MTPVAIAPATKGPKHHFFGFHDLVQWNDRGDLMLALAVESISHPPLPGEAAVVGVVNPDTREFVPITKTLAFNYPQGARQQWLCDSNRFLFNDRVGDAWGCRIADAGSRSLVGELPFSIHACDPVTGDAYGLDYARLQRVGGYGYTGLTDRLAGEDIPATAGIHKGNVSGGRARLLVSVLDAAQCGEKQAVTTGYPHYLTHLLLSPSRTRLAFLHRYRLPDGGETTRLLTVGADGSSLRCLAKGFLSHFAWLDDGLILIWGRAGGSASVLRESPLLRLPGLRPALHLAKGAARALLRPRGGPAALSFLAVTDSETPQPRPVGAGVLTEDGHPMACPADRDWLVNDTYPDAEGVRKLMLYQASTNRRVDLGSFRMLDARPDPATFDVAAATDGVDGRVRRHFAEPLYLFTRSGYHCDLHPRWKGDGSAVAFDSIHEGTRQIYVVDVSAMVRPLISVKEGKTSCRK